MKKPRDSDFFFFKWIKVTKLLEGKAPLRLPVCTGTCMNLIHYLYPKSAFLKNNRYINPDTQKCCCSITKSCLTLRDPLCCSMPGFPVLHYIPEFAQTHVQWVSNAIQPSHLLSPPCPTAFNLSQHQGLFQWVGSFHHVANVLKLQLQHHLVLWCITLTSASIPMWLFQGLSTLDLGLTWKVQDDLILPCLT